MFRHAHHLAVGLSVLAACGSTLGAGQPPAEGGAARDAAPAEAERPISLRTVNPAARTRSSAPAVLTRRDIRTGEEVQIPLDQAGGSVQDAVQALLAGGNAETFFDDVRRALGQSDDGSTPPNPGLAEFGEDLIMDRGMSSRTLVTNTSISPNSRNCKMRMTFAGREFVGSAVMIDARWCMTAAHCVHTSSDPEHGLPAGIYATNVRVYPGYNNGENPAFGHAKALATYTLSGWRNDADWDYDIAFIELDRPIGALCGWAGFGAFNGETGLIFSGTTYGYKGYPAAGGYDGQRMYSRTGDFDIRWGNVVYTAAMSYGGESGSGFVRTNGVAQAVLSHGANLSSIGGATGAVVVWGDLYSTQANRIFASTPVQADLIPLMVRTATTAKNRGGTIPAVDIVIHNYSRSAFSGTPVVTFRFSANEYISASDAGTVRAGSYVTIPPRSSRAVRFLNVAVPATAPIGNLYLGATLNNTDANILNNATHPVDTDRLTVN